MMETRRFTGKLRGWLPLLPLLLLLLASYWLSLQVAPQPSVVRVLRHDVDFVIDKLSTTTLNEAGQPRFTLSAEKMWHYPDDNTTHLQAPMLTSYFPARPPAYTSAKNGILSNNNSDVTLNDEVRVLRPASGKLVEQRIQTDYLHVVPDKDWADTDHPVLVVSGRNTISAVGMELDIQAQSIKLLSQVRATHEPSRK